MKRTKMLKTVATVLATLTLLGGCSFLDNKDTSKKTEEVTEEETETEATTTTETTVEETTTTAETTTETTEETTEATTTEETTTEVTETTEATEETSETTEPSETSAIEDKKSSGKTPSYEAVCEFPEITEPFEIEEDLAASYKTYLNDILAAKLGESAPFELKFAEDPDFPQKDYVPDISGITGHMSADLDGDGTVELIGTGFAKREADSEDYSYEYIPYIFVCQADYDEIKFRDVMFYAPEDPEGYHYGSTMITSTQTSTNVYSYYLSPDNTIIMLFTSAGFIGDGGHTNALEFTFKDGKITPLKMLYQTNGGSDGFEYKVYDLTNPEDEGTQLEEDDYLDPYEAIGKVWPDLGISLLNVRFEGTQAKNVSYLMQQIAK